MPELLNLTPHDITIISDDTRRVVIPCSGFIARVGVKYEPVRDSRPGVPVVVATYGDVVITAPDGSTGPFEDFAAAQGDDAVYIVSRVVAEALKQRLPGALAARIGRVYVPATGPGMAVRGEDGRIIGVRALEAVDLV